MKKIYFVLLTLLLLLLVSCVNSANSNGSKDSSKPDYTGRYEASNGNYFELDCSEEAVQEIMKFSDLIGDGPKVPYDGTGTFRYIAAEGRLYVNLWVPFTINGEEVKFDDKAYTTVTISGDILTDPTGRTYTKK